MMKKILFTLAIGIATLTSCESDSTTTTTDEVGILLKKSIDTFEDGSAIEITFTYDGNKLIKVEEVGDYGEGLETDIEEFTYTGELLTRIDEETINSDGSTDSNYTILEYDASDRLITETSTYTGEPSSTNTFSHNADGTITFNEEGGEIYIFTYVGGNVVSENNTTGDSDYTTVYDDKNSPLKNIHQREVFELLGYYAFENNKLSYTNTGGLTYPENATYSYTYNSENYPVALTNLYYPGGTAEEETNTTEYFYE